MSRRIAVPAASAATTLTLLPSRRVRRAVRGLAALFALIAAPTVAAGAQSSGSSSMFDARRMERRPYVGAIVPTGDARDVLQDAVLVGAQASYAFTNSFADLVLERIVDVPPARIFAGWTQPAHDAVVHPRASQTMATVPFVMSAEIWLEPHGSGTRYVATAIHADEESRRKHEEMGFHAGWGAALDQLVALIERT